MSEFLVPDVCGGISGPGWQDHNAKDKNSPATLSATTRSPDSSTGLSGKLKVFNEKTEEGIEQLVAVIATITPDD